MKLCIETQSFDCIDFKEHIFNFLYEPIQVISPTQQIYKLIPHQNDDATYQTRILTHLA